jgi:F420H(2)-dependent quinone reductase
MAKYVPSPRDWVREQVELYENSGGTKGTTLRDTGLPVVLVTHWGNKTSAIRKTPLMRVKDGDNYILVGSQGGAPKDPAWAHNLRVNPHIELRDETIVRPMPVRVQGFHPASTMPHITGAVRKRRTTIPGCSQQTSSRQE